MNHEEVAKILAEAALCDNRHVDDLMIVQWHRIIGHLPYDDTSQAVVDHFAQTDDYLKPIDLIRRVKAARERRLTAAPLPAPSPEPGQYLNQIRGVIHQVASGYATPPAISSGAASADPTAEYRQAREQITTRRPTRDAVLSYPDLAKRLTEPPLDYAEPSQWNGFVPPEEFNGQHNASPRRTALAEIVAEAHARDAEGPAT